MIDAIEGKGYCPVCCKRDQPIKVGWVEAKCDGCGFYSYINPPNLTVKNRRSLLKLSKKEMAERMNLKVSTITKYEKDWPSERYWEATKKLVLAEEPKP